MAAETDLDHLREIGYVILKRCIEPQFVKEARTSIEEKVRAVTKMSPTEHYVSLYKTSDDWPMECKRLYHETMKALPYSSLRSNDSPPDLNLTIGVYQPIEGLFRGSNAQRVLFYTVPLDETVNQVNGLPLYLDGSYKADPTMNTQCENKDLELNQGDVLVWEGRTILQSKGTGGAAFMVFKWECK